MTEAAAQRDRYRILRPIGSGGMSQVFEAFDESLKRSVALKVLHPHLAANPEARARFAREAQATARLRHPNIVEIFDVAGLDSREAFIVTELIRGPTLRAFAELHRFAPPSELALSVMHELARALAHAHENGVVHRDLKPENVMLTESGGLKLMDFGIARILDTETRMTMTGALVGSPLHMAPEIIEGERATPASDVFSAGTILYWLACGVQPFLGNNASQTLRKILDGERPDPRLSAPFLSERQCALLDRCLDRDPSRRLVDGRALLRAIEEILSDEGVGDPAIRLRSFIARPEASRAALTVELVARWNGQAEAALAETPPNVARAVERLDRAMCVAPQDAASQALHARVRHLRQAARRRAWWRRLGIGGGLLLGLIGAIAWLSNRAPASPDLPPAPGGSQVDPTPPRALAVPAPPPAAGSPEASPKAPRAVDSRSSPSLDARQGGKAPDERASMAPVDGASSTRATPAPAEAAPRAPMEASLKVAGPGAAMTRGGGTESAPPVDRRARRASTRPARGAAKGASGRLEVMVQHATHGLTWGKIYLDGQWINGHSPAWTGEVEVGRHELRVEAPCCLAETRSVMVAAGDQTPPVIFRLLSRPALLSVVSDEACEIWLDGTRRASCLDSVRDPVAVPLPRGALRSDVTFLLVRPGKEDLARTERFEAGQLREIRVRFAAED